MSDMPFTEATPSRAVSAPSVERSELPHTGIEPSKRWISLGLKNLWQYRELLFSLQSVSTNLESRLPESRRITQSSSATKREIQIELEKEHKVL
jgi:hypothetical protein